MGDILITPSSSGAFMQGLDITFKSATIAIALFNSYFAIKIFHVKDRKDGEEKEKDRRLQLLKTLVLDHNLSKYHSIFEVIDKELESLKANNLTDSDKQKIDSNLGDLFIEFRRKFYDALLGIDENLYDKIKSEFDILQTHLTESIFNPGINLAHLPKFDETISQKVTSTKTEIIKLLFSYRG